MFKYINVISNIDNLGEKQLCNHLLDLSQFFKDYHTFLYDFFNGWKKIFSTNYNIVIFYRQITQKVYLLPKNSDQLSIPNIGLLYLLNLLYGLFLWMGFNCLKATNPLRGGSLRFAFKFPEILGTHLTDLRRMKHWVNLGSTQWFWTRDHWVVNPAP